MNVSLLLKDKKTKRFIKMEVSMKVNMNIKVKMGKIKKVDKKYCIYYFCLIIFILLLLPYFISCSFDLTVLSYCFLS